MYLKFRKNILDILIIAGALTSAYLLYVHYLAYNNPSSITGLCRFNKLINCEATSLSSWSIFGGMPIAFWGLVCFATLMILRRYGCHSIAALLSAVMLAKSGYLLYVSKVQLQTFCPFCILINLITLFIFIGQMGQFIRMAKEIKEEHRSNLINLLKRELSASASSLKCFPAFLAVVVTTAIAYPRYWEMPPINCENITCGVTEDNHPYIESKVPPELFIEEYSDYSCSNCLNGQRLIRNLISRGARARLIHRNYPLSSDCNPLISESPFHKFSCTYALWSIGVLKAAGPGSFWKVNDLIFEKKGLINMAELSIITGQNYEDFKKIAETEESAQHLAMDIISGIKLEITGTPTYFLNGEKLSFLEIIAALKANHAVQKKRASG